MSLIFNREIVDFGSINDFIVVGLGGVLVVLVDCRTFL
jgi:hypothetical protein